MHGKKSEMHHDVDKTHWGSAMDEKKKYRWRDFNSSP